MGWAVTGMPWERALVPILQEAGWTQEPVWIGAKNVSSPKFQTRNCTAYSELLYWLHYLANTKNALLNQNVYQCGEAAMERVLFPLEK